MTSSTERRLLIDLETYSSADITKTGAFKYAEAPDFEILLLACAWDDGPVQVIDMTEREPVTDERTAAKAAALASVVAGITDPDTVKVAHNSAFERACLTRYLGRDLPPEEWEDTMILAAMNGLPLSLDAAGAALELRDQKIREGTALISYFCKPCKPTIANGGRTRNLPEHAPDKWERFKAYCKRDVEVEQAIYRRLRSFPVTDFERKVWALDARINERGVRIDTGLVAAAIAQNEAFTTRRMAEMRRLTGLENPNSVAQLKDWLETAGMSADSLNKAAVQELKDKAADPTTRRVLELRQQLGKTSVTKYEAMQSAVCADGRVRGLLQYYGAGRTGRWAGRLVQVQNLPQNHLAGLGLVRELVRERDLETLELCFDSVPDVLSQLIRTAFVAGEGNIFHVADYSAIEARVLAWLANEEWVLEEFRGKGKIYEATASRMFHIPQESIVKGNPNYEYRQKGKQATLSCGYGGGVGALKAMGAKMPEEEMQPLVDAWRAANPNIVAFWSALDRAARTVIRKKTSARVGKVTLYWQDDKMFMRLPSGRNLCYQSPHFTENRFGSDAIGYYAPNAAGQRVVQETFGGKLAENATQAIARDILAHALLTLEKNGYPVIFHVHDEAVIEKPTGQGSLEEACRLMAIAPNWAEELPLRADGYECMYYRKD